MLSAFSFWAIIIMINPARVDFGIRCLMHIDIVCVTFLLAELSVYVELRQTLGTASAKVCVTFFVSPISVLRRRHVFVFGSGSSFSQSVPPLHEAYSQT